MKTKVGDVLKFVADQPLSQFDWHIALIHHLNQNVPPDQQVQPNQTGKEVIAHLMLRGVEQAMLMMNMVFDTSDGKLYTEEQVATPTVVVAPVPAAVPTPIQYQWTPQKVSLIAIGTLIALMTIFFTYQGGREPTPGQQRVMETAIQVLGDLAREGGKTAQPAEEPTAPPVEPAPQTDPNAPAGGPYP